MVVVTFSITDKANLVKCFEKVVLVANVSSKIVLEIFSPTINDANIDFLHWKLYWKTYTSQKALPTIRRVELEEKKEFAAAMLDLEYETFVVHVASLSSVIFFNSILRDTNIHLFRKPQIASLIAKKALTKVFTKYANFTNIFFLDLAFKLPKYTGINNHAIKLVDGQQLFYRPIYSLKLVKLETLKAYIEINQANKLIKLFKPSVGTLIFFDRKSNGSF